MSRWVGDAVLYLGPRVRSARLLRSLPLRTVALLSPLPIALDACVPLRWQVVRSPDALVDNVMDENANLSFDRERGGRARLSFRTNQPRTIGVTLRRQY